MITYKIIPLNKLVSSFPSERISEILSSFSCKKDNDVEIYLKEKAVFHEKRHISRTYLLFTSEPYPKLTAYFTIAINSMGINDLECSTDLRKKLNINKDSAQSYLIGQIGKCDGGPKGLGGSAILSAIGLLRDVNSKVGCRVIRLDCKPALIKYYERNGFTLIRQNRDGDLNQMVYIIA